MTSSFVAKSLQSSSYKGRDPTSPTRKYSSSTTSSSRRDEETAATRRLPLPRKESLSRYNVGSSSRKSKKSNFPANAASKSSDGLPTRRLSGAILSPNRTLGKNDIPLVPSTSRRSSLNKSEFVTSPLRHIPLGRKSFEGPPMPMDPIAKLQESPYLSKGLHERPLGALQRRPSFGDHLQNLSRSTQELGFSPIVSTLSSSPIVDFPDAPGARSYSRLPDPNDNISTNASSIFGVQNQNSSPENVTGISQHQQDLERGVPLNETGREQPSVSMGEDPLSPHPAFQSSVGAGFKSTVYPSGGASGVSLVTNPLYPLLPSPEPSISPPTSASYRGGFDKPATNMNFPSSMVGPSLPHELNATEYTINRRMQMADQQALKANKETNSTTSEASDKRRGQVRGTVDRARSRLSQLSQETAQRRKHFGKWWFGRFRKWIFERQQKRSKGKGLKLLYLWEKSLKSIETRYGSSIMLAFLFIRWVFLLNAVLAILWTAAMIIPFMVHPPMTFNWKAFFQKLSKKEAWKSIVQGQELEKTFVYYGGYTYQRWEQKGRYRVDYMYPVLIGATFLISFIGALWRIAGGIVSSGNIAMATRLYPFSSLVFVSWDFHITSLEAASKLRRGIRMHLKEMLADTKMKTRNIGTGSRLMSAKRFIALFILWPLVMGGNVFAVIELVRKAELINEKLGSQYAQALLFSLMNNIMPTIVRVLVDMEDFRPAMAERVVLSKLFFLRTLSLATLFYRLFMMLHHTLAVRSGVAPIEACEGKLTCSEGFTCCTQVNMTEWDICTQNDINSCLPACTENVVGAQLLRLISITTLVRAVSELAYGFGYVWTSSGCWVNLMPRKLQRKRQLLIEDMAIDVVYVQALIWVGVCFSPIAAVLGFFSNLLTWYTMRLALFRTCAPVERAYSASRTASLTYGLLLFTLVLSTVPATISFMQKNSGFCGPIHQQISMYTVISSYIQKAPSGLWMTLNWIFNPAILVGAILLLVFVVVIVQSELLQTRQFLALTKYEMGAQRKQSSAKYKRIRQTLMSGSIESNLMPKLDLSPRIGSIALNQHISSPAPTLPGQVEGGTPPREHFESHKDI